MNQENYSTIPEQETLKKNKVHAFHTDAQMQSSWVPSGSKEIQLCRLKW